MLSVLVEKLYVGKKTSGFKVVLNEERVYFLKVFHHPLRFRKIFPGLFFLTRPQREFEFSRILESKGFLVPKVVSFRFRKLWGFLPVNIGCTKSVYLEGIIPLDKIIKTEDFDFYFEKSLTILARLHRMGFIHRDASLTNFAIYDGQLYLIDLEAITKVFPLFPFSRFRNFVNFINDALKRGVVIDPEKVLEIYLREFNFPFGRSYLTSKLYALLRRREIENSHNSA